MTIVTIVVVKPCGSGGSSSFNSYIVSLSSSVVIGRLGALLNVMLRDYITLFLVGIQIRYMWLLLPL